MHARHAATITPPGRSQEARIGEDSKSTIAVNAARVVASIASRDFRYGPRVRVGESHAISRGSACTREADRTIRAVTNGPHTTLSRNAVGVTVLSARPLAQWVVAASLLICVSAPSAAKFSAIEGFAQKATPPSTTADEFAPTPVVATALGFRMRVPVGTAVRIERAAVTSYLFAEGGEEPAWRIRATSLGATKPDSTAKSQCQEYLRELGDKEKALEVLVDEPRTIAGREAHVIYLGVPLESGTRGIMGLLVVPSANNGSIVFSMLIVDGAFARVRPLLDRTFATLELRDTEKALVESSDLLASGAMIATAITPEMLRSTIDPEPRVYRMWKPGPTGEKKDYGYMIVRVREGRHGEVDASKDPATLKGEDNDLGLFASIDARIVSGDDATHTVDAQSRYFVRWDRSAEAWSIRTTERQKRASRSSAQTGLRLPPSTGAPRPNLQVISASRDGMTREPLEWPIPPVYFSQAELIVLGELLPRDAATTKLAFKDYAFDQRDQKLPQRHETWTRIEHGWRLETQQGSSPAKIVQEFDGRGKRVRRVDIDGSVTELIALDDLRTLWKAKGLPVD